MRAEKVGATQHYRLTRTAIEEIELKIGSRPTPIEPNPALKIESDPATATNGGHGEGICARASSWMKQHLITREQLEHIFSTETGRVEFIASRLPSESKRHQTHQAYLMCGLCSFIHTGELTFADSAARALCEHLGCFDLRNHSSITKAFGNTITGSKVTGWRLTTPGLNESANIIKQLVPK